MKKVGRTNNRYSHEIKKEAIRLHIQEGWTYRRIMQHFGIPDRHRLKVWMRKYKQQGEFGLVDHRGRPETYVDPKRYVKRLEMENAVLKKWLEITKGEVYRLSIASYKNCGMSIQSTPSVDNSTCPEADFTRIKSV